MKTNSHSIYYVVRCRSSVLYLWNICNLPQFTMHGAWWMCLCTGRNIGRSNWPLPLYASASTTQFKTYYLYVYVVCDRVFGTRWLARPFSQCATFLAVLFILACCYFRFPSFRSLCLTEGRYGNIHKLSRKTGRYIHTQLLWWWWWWWWLRTHKRTAKENEHSGQKRFGLTCSRTENIYGYFSVKWLRVVHGMIAKWLWGKRGHLRLSDPKPYIRHFRSSFFFFFFSFLLFRFALTKDIRNLLYNIYKRYVYNPVSTIQWVKCEALRNGMPSVPSLTRSLSSFSHYFSFFPAVSKLLLW